MIKKHFYLLFLLLSSIALQAQTISGLESMPTDSIAKEIVDYAKLRFFYKLRYVEDTKKPDKISEQQCELNVGEKCSIFADSYVLMKDSINDAIARRKGTAMEVFAQLSGLPSPLERWNSRLLKGYPEGKYKEWYHLFAMNELEYDSPRIDFDWQIAAETKELMGFQCRRATCTHAGRSYTAWYAEELALSEGPYIFAGLPGLIVELASDDGEYHFLLNGMQNIDFALPIYYLTNSKVKKASRKEVRQIIRNGHENYGQIMQEHFDRIVVRSSTPINMRNRPPKPYNPIEKE